MSSTRLYKKLHNKGYIPKKVAEVGVYLPQTSNILDWVNDGIESILVEPDPVTVDAIKKYFPNSSNITLHPCAVADERGTLELIRAGASTYASNLPHSPAIVNDGNVRENSESFSVKVVLFSDVDPGDLNILSIDIEGGEWFVLKHMKSRPDLISIETHAGAYINPYINKIADWMKANDYLLWYKDGSDSVYIKCNLFKITILDAIELKRRNISLYIEKKRKELKKSIRKLIS